MDKLVSLNNLNFVAIDVETANADMASLCQIGIAKYQDGKLIDEWTSLVNPEDYFDPVNISIHGITEDHVMGAPTFSEVYSTLDDFLSNTVCVCHTHFDRVSINKAIEEYNLEAINSIWLDSARVARRTWEVCAWRGYGLSNVCKLIGYEFKHHDALEDAKACSEILLAAVKTTGLDINAWLERVEQPIDVEKSSSGSAIKREGDPEGELYGEVVVFTGSLSISRSEAANLASNIGCSVRNSVTNKTTLLVVGDQDISRLGGKKKSSKHIKAEKLLSKGKKIRILRECDFKDLVKYSHEYV